VRNRRTDGQARPVMRPIRTAARQLSRLETRACRCMCGQLVISRTDHSLTTTIAAAAAAVDTGLTAGVKATRYTGRLQQP